MYISNNDILVYHLFQNTKSSTPLFLEATKVTYFA